MKKNNTKDVNDSKKSGQVHRVEAGYDANNLFVGVGYQQTKGWDTELTYMNGITNGFMKYAIEAEAPASAKATAFAKANEASYGVKTQEAAVTAAYRFGNVTPRISYAHGWDAKQLAGDKIKGSKYDQVILGADYDFSKRTTAFAQAGWLRAGKSGEDMVKVTNTGGLVGLRHKF